MTRVLCVASLSLSLSIKFLPSLALSLCLSVFAELYKADVLVSEPEFVRSFAGVAG